jgi:hypothetical protein
MSALKCLAIIGKANEPLYLKDIPSFKDKPYEKDGEDAFGFAATLEEGQLSLRKEVSSHETLELFDWDYKYLKIFFNNS